VKFRTLKLDLIKTHIYSSDLHKIYIEPITCQFSVENTRQTFINVHKRTENESEIFLTIFLVEGSNTKSPSTNLLKIYSIFCTDFFLMSLLLCWGYAARCQTV